MDDILAVLSRVKDPETGKSLSALGVVPSVRTTDQGAVVLLTVDPVAGARLESLRAHIQTLLTEDFPRATIKVILTAHDVAKRPAPQPMEGLAEGVKAIIAVASGKGGVGKSTVAVNLAVALAQQGLRVGLLDADIYGPSVPRLTGLRGMRPEKRGDKIQPLSAHGLSVMSIGFMLEGEDSPLIWRGPMIQSALVQLLRDVDWTGVDILVLDLPPGTGDVQLTLAQKVKMAGAVIVSTPQDLALIDARKAIAMFQKVQVPLLGIVENMSVFCCPACGHETAIFGTQGARDEAARQKVPFLGALPLESRVRELSDAGTPIVTAMPDHAATKIYQEIAQKVVQACNLTRASSEPPFERKTQ